MDNNNNMRWLDAVALSGFAFVFKNSIDANGDFSNIMKQNDLIIKQNNFIIKQNEFLIRQLEMQKNL